MKQIEAGLLLVAEGALVALQQLIAGGLGVTRVTSKASMALALLSEVTGVRFSAKGAAEVLNVVRHAELDLFARYRGMPVNRGAYTKLAVVVAQ